MVNISNINVKKVAIALISLWFIIFGFSNSVNVPKFISPLSNTMKVSAAMRQIHDKFSFAPGWAFNNINLVNFDGLQTLAYFDVPLAGDGTLYTETTGYEMFNEHGPELLEKSHANGSKFVLTISQTDPDAIRELLASPTAQKTAVSEIIKEVKSTGIDGVVLDVEYKAPATSSQKTAFNNFVRNLTTQMHAAVPHSQVSVALSRTTTENSLYDLKVINENADKIFVMSYDLAVPEEVNGESATPKYSFSEAEYWTEMSNYMDEFVQKVSTERLVMERAWYGNGDNYPLYSPKGTGSAATQTGIETNISLPLDSKTVERMVRDVPADARAAARKNLPIIAEALKKEGILNTNVLAYALATIEHETAGTFEPIEEYGGRKSARRLGYEGGTNYFGRGFIQLTHLRNYQTVGQRIGMGDELVKHPELALRSDVSAHILAAFFKDNGIATLASNGHFVAARQPVNPDQQGWWIASLAVKYLNDLG